MRHQAFLADGCGERSSAVSRLCGCAAGPAAQMNVLPEKKRPIRPRTNEGVPSLQAWCERILEEGQGG